MAFLQKVAATCLVQLKIDVYATSRPEDIDASLDHGERKVSEFLHNSYRIGMLDKRNKTCLYDRRGQRFSFIVMHMARDLE